MNKKKFIKSSPRCSLGTGSNAWSLHMTIFKLNNQLERKEKKRKHNDVDDLIKARAKAKNQSRSDINKGEKGLEGETNNHDF